MHVLPWVTVMLVLATAGCRKTPSPSLQGPEGATDGGAAQSGRSPSSAPAPSAASEQATGKDQKGSLADRLNAVQSGEADKPGKPILPDLKPFPQGATAPNIPLVKGLVLNGTISPNRKAGDDDHATSIESVSPTSVTVLVDADRGPDKSPDGKPRKKRPGCTVLIDRADFAHSNNFRPFVCQRNPDHYPGTNSLGASTDMLAQLRSGQQVEFHFGTDSQMTDMLATSFAGSMGGPKVSPRAGVEMYGCNLHRVEPVDLAWPVLLNDQPVDLPVLHAMCTFDDGEESHIYFLDQIDNPLSMYGQLGLDPEVFGILQITLPPADQIKAAQQAQSNMEKALADKKPVEIYGIYFDFNSAVIKPRSESVLNQIAGILKKNPAWKLSVSGHTDNIGEDSFNLTLSQQRSAAVKDALVSRYKIAPDRLATSGHGASQPIATNDTMIGRAKNRRVELQRQ